MVGSLKQYRSPRQRWGGVRILINSGSVKPWLLQKKMDEGPPVRFFDFITPKLDQSGPKWPKLAEIRNILNAKK